MLPCQVKFQDITLKTGRGEVVPGHNHISTDIAAQVIMTHIEAMPGHDTGIIATSPGVAHDTPVPYTGVTTIDPAGTHHIDPTTDHSHAEVHHPTTPEIEADPAHIHPTNPPVEIHIGHTHIPADHKANHITRRTPE